MWNQRSSNDERILVEVCREIKNEFPKVITRLGGKKDKYIVLDHHSFNWTWGGRTAGGPDDLLGSVEEAEHLYRLIVTEMFFSVIKQIKNSYIETNDIPALHSALPFRYNQTRFLNTLDAVHKPELLIVPGSMVAYWRENDFGSVLATGERETVMNLFTTGYFYMGIPVWINRGNSYEIYVLGEGAVRYNYERLIDYVKSISPEHFYPTYFFHSDLTLDIVSSQIRILMLEGF